MSEWWDLAIAPVTARSRLYSLAPIGVGTAFVESLSGYVARLAEAHAVLVGCLLGKELSCLVKAGGIRPALVSHAINGVGDGAKRWVQALETQTLRSDLRYLTLLPFERLLPKPLLFRRVRAWCPACYEHMSSRGGPIYDLLLWCLKLVEVCPRRHGFLATTCPHCSRSLRPLSAASRPGFCSRCGLWLGHATSRTDSASGAVPTEYQLWLAEAIGELLANAPRVPPELLRDRARSALSAYADAFAEGNRTAVADMARHRRNALYGWFNGDQAPRIDTLLHTWYQLKLPVASLLDGAYPRLSPEARAQRSLEIRNTREVAPKRGREQRCAALREALHEQPAPSLTEVARRLGYTTTTRLRDADRELCRQIVLNYRKSGRSYWWRNRGAKPICELLRVKEVLEASLAGENPIPSLDRIATSLGYAVDQSLRQKFPELCRALSAKIAEQRRTRVAAIQPALEQALRETPPPSLPKMAERLGFSAARVLEAHAQALCEKLEQCRRAYFAACRTELRNKLKAALEESPPPSLRQIYSRLGVTESILNTGFPELRQAIGLRHRQYRRQQAQARKYAVRAEIRGIVRRLREQGICPSVPRVTSLLQSGSLREWRVISKAVNDARRDLMTD